MDVPSFPRSKWDSENDSSEIDEMIFDDPAEGFVLIKDPIPISSPKSHSQENLLLQSEPLSVIAVSTEHKSERKSVSEERKQSVTEEGN